MTSEELRRWLEQTRVHIGGLDYKVKFEEGLWMRTGTPGHVQMTTNVITIDPTISDGNVLTVLLHEIIEAIDHRYNLGSHHYVIKTYEVALFSFLVNNRELIALYGDGMEADGRTTETRVYNSAGAARAANESREATMDDELRAILQ
jgi:hypothetical protein